jgi:hypothetical protein
MQYASQLNVRCVFLPQQNNSVDMIIRGMTIQAKAQYENQKGFPVSTFGGGPTSCTGAAFLF